MPSTHSHLAGVAGVVAASCLWGTTGVSASLAPEVGPIAIGAAAMGGGGLLQALLALPLVRQAAPKLLCRWLFILAAGLSVAVYPLAFYGSMRLAGITVGTVVSIGSSPVLAALVEMIADKAKPSARFIAAAALGIIGIAVLSVARSGDEAAASGTLPGILCGLAAGLTYAYYSWAARRLMRDGIPGKAAMGALFGTGAVFLFPVLLLTGAPFLNSLGNLAVGLYMAMIPMFLGYLFFGYGLARVSASEATTISLLEPVVAALLAALVAGERLTLPAWAGIALIFSSLLAFILPFGKKGG